MANEGTYQITLKSGRKFTVRPLPKHFFMYYGELPNSLLEQAVTAVQKGQSATDFAADFSQELTAEEIKNLLIFTRESVNCFCISPRLSLNPQEKDEMSPLELSDEEFNELSGLAMRSSTEPGGLAAGLTSFR